MSPPPAFNLHRIQNGTSPESLLDTYQRERHPVAARALRYTMAQAALGRRMPDLDLVTAEGPLRAFELLHDAKPVLLNLGAPRSLDITPWADRVRLVEASYEGEWELPVLGVVSAPGAVLVRPDGYVAWVGDRTDMALDDALATWFGPPRTGALG